MIEKFYTRAEINIRENCKLYNMDYGAPDSYSVVLVSFRFDQPYEDKKLEKGVIEYEGHDNTELDPKIRKLHDQITTWYGKTNANGQFWEAAKAYEKGDIKQPRAVKIYERLSKEFSREYDNFEYTDLGFYKLISAKYVSDEKRLSFKFYLEPGNENLVRSRTNLDEILKVERVAIPREIKQLVFDRDNGRCVKCKSSQNLQFDHDFPYSLGGTSLSPDNIQILCIKCNTKKSNYIR